MPNSLPDTNTHKVKMYLYYFFAKSTKKKNLKVEKSLCDREPSVGKHSVLNGVCIESIVF